VKVDLIADRCAIYQFWSRWLTDSNPPAALVLDGGHPVKYFNSTASNRYRYALKNGYTAVEISWSKRNEYLNDIHAVNNSVPILQGREMKDSYKEYPSQSSEADQCQAHYATFIGAFKDGHLVGYISTNFCGQLAASSQIIGHGDHLKNGVMLVLWAEFVRICQERGMAMIVYSRWSDGKDGLRYWKHSVGMRQTSIQEKT